MGGLAVSHYITLSLAVTLSDKPMRDHTTSLTYPNQPSSLDCDPPSTCLYHIPPGGGGGTSISSLGNPVISKRHSRGQSDLDTWISVSPFAFTSVSYGS
ncbi:hypothetical protein SDJN03_15570, partial [Cucurbita argyrosperma subsp. sororia]